MALISLKASPVGSTLFEVSDAGAVSAAGLASTGAITGTSATLTGALSAAGLTSTGLDTYGIQNISMGGNNKTLILSGTPTANQVLLTGNLITASATGSTRTLTLPAASSMTGKLLHVFNVGSIQIDVTDGTTTASIAGGGAAIVVSNGSGYGKLMGA